MLVRNSKKHSHNDEQFNICKCGSLRRAELLLNKTACEGRSNGLSKDKLNTLCSFERQPPENITEGKTLSIIKQ